MTGTYKLRKVEFQKHGIDPNGLTKDKLYYLDVASKKYLPLDTEVYENIRTGKIRL